MIGCTECSKNMKTSINRRFLFKRFQVIFFLAKTFVTALLMNLLINISLK